MPPSTFRFTCCRRAESGGLIRLLLAGELDLATLPDFRSALDDAQTDSDRVLLDLGALTLIDCAAIAILFAAAGRSRREGSVLILLSPHGQVRRVLRLVGAPAEITVGSRGDFPERRVRVAA